jgi:Tat protein secretion system quality control protein TatD with DNase activity
VKGYQVYGRNEPYNVKRVIEALAGIKGIPEDEVATVVY